MADLWDDFDDDEFPDDWSPFNCDVDGGSDKAELEGEEIDEITDEQLQHIRQQILAKQLEPKPYDHKATKKIIAICDTETDPFDYGASIEPFCLGFDTGDRYVEFWGDDCIQQFFVFLAAETSQGVEYIIYAHNGGKFDFYFMLDYLDPDQSPLIMNGRIVKAYMRGQEFRDSFAIIPQALSSYKKDEIDYSNFTRDKREKHKKQILAYLKSDCAYTRELIVGFHDMFGDKLTIASAALPMLHSHHGFQRIRTDSIDERFRQFYYGGRNQCFEHGILQGNWLVYDRNSMYPAVMRDALHPIGSQFTLQSDIDDDTDFACIIARNKNCLPIRAKDGGLDFTCTHGTFYATIHEIKAGLETGTLEIERVKHAWSFEKKTSFTTFVEQFYNLRLEAKTKGDKIRDILYKLCLNSAYGKFALNPRKFKQWTFTIDEVPQPLAGPDNPDGWSLHSQTENLFIWSRPNPRRNGFYNVATAASITGAARANLHRNICRAKRPIYCDTDSIICLGMDQANLGESELGAWKLEATGTRAAIGGKKLYAIFNEGEAIKQASKGVRLEAADIVAICRGQTIVHNNPAPTFKLNGETEYISRTIKMTF